MDADALIDPFVRLLADVFPPDRVRAIEMGAPWTEAWDAIARSGFLDALVPEPAGGAGLPLPAMAPLFAALGAQAVPLPVGETMIARALLAEAGVQAPDGPIVLASGAAPTPLARVATHALTGDPAAPRLIALADVADTGVFASLDGLVPGADAAIRPIAAVLRAALIAGAAERVMAMTVEHARTRVQFGKPVGGQQAVQQQLAVLAEHAIAARMAAALGLAGGLAIDTRAAAIAKHGASEAAAAITGIAHAVHGAIGISAEHDLQLLTRRLHGWRLADGSEGYWAARLGAIRLDEEGDTLAFILETAPAAA